MKELFINEVSTMQRCAYTFYFATHAFTSLKSTTLINQTSDSQQLMHLIHNHPEIEHKTSLDSTVLEMP
jgi:hypothetical protein